MDQQSCTELSAAFERYKHAGAQCASLRGRTLDLPTCVAEGTDDVHSAIIALLNAVADHAQQCARTRAEHADLEEQYRALHQEILKMRTKIENANRERPKHEENMHILFDSKRKRKDANGHKANGTGKTSAQAQPKKLHEWRQKLLAAEAELLALQQSRDAADELYRNAEAAVSAAHEELHALLKRTREAALAALQQKHVQRIRRNGTYAIPPLRKKYSLPTGKTLEEELEKRLHLPTPCSLDEMDAEIAANRPKTAEEIAREVLSQGIAEQSIIVVGKSYWPEQQAFEVNMQGPAGGEPLNETPATSASRSSTRARSR